jgi:hypothetical protein
MLYSIYSLYNAEKWWSDLQCSMPPSPRMTVETEWKKRIVRLTEGNGPPPPHQWLYNGFIMVQKKRTCNVRKSWFTFVNQSPRSLVVISVAEPHHFYAAPAPGKNFDAAPAPAPAPTLLYSKTKIWKWTKVKTNVETILCIWFCTIYIDKIWTEWAINWYILCLFSITNHV